MSKKDNVVIEIKRELAREASSKLDISLLRKKGDRSEYIVRSKSLQGIKVIYYKDKIINLPSGDSSHTLNDGSVVRIKHTGDDVQINKTERVEYFYPNPDKETIYSCKWNGQGTSVNVTDSTVLVNGECLIADLSGDRNIIPNILGEGFSFRPEEYVLTHSVCEDGSVLVETTERSIKTKDLGMSLAALDCCASKKLQQDSLGLDGDAIFSARLTDSLVWEYEDLIPALLDEVKFDLKEGNSVYRADKVGKREQYLLINGDHRIYKLTIYDGNLISILEDQAAITSNNGYVYKTECDGGKFTVNVYDAMSCHGDNLKDIEYVRSLTYPEIYYKSYWVDVDKGNFVAGDTYHTPTETGDFIARKLSPELTPEKDEVVIAFLMTDVKDRKFLMVTDSAVRYSEEGETGQIYVDCCIAYSNGQLHISKSNSSTSKVLADIVDKFGVTIVEHL